jgi:glycosylphosphatidylinositol transamidase (GPIT) subunit GPI8
MSEKIDNSSLSLNKAANLLGVNEINKFDYKSLNSIRKLAKTLGCNEYDLMKTFSNSNTNG